MVVVFFKFFFFKSSLKSTIIKEDEIESRQVRINQKLFTDPVLNMNPLKAADFECGFVLFCFCKNIESNKRNLIPSSHDDKPCDIFFNIINT